MRIQIKARELRKGQRVYLNQKTTTSWVCRSVGEKAAYLKHPRGGDRPDRVIDLHTRVWVVEKGVKVR